MFKILSFLITSIFSIAAYTQVDASYLSSEVNLRLDRVPEFLFIREEARKLGVKVYLFGGTASAFAHYVRWDLEREAGDEKYQAERFDYDFTNIYRGNQDLDIVVDGSPADANLLKEVLTAKYPHFTGVRQEWEIRLLRQGLDDKEALLDSKEFRNQHTDSNSIGMIDLTAGKNEAVFRDLLDWNNEKPRYLDDVAAARIKYLYNPKHGSTKRYKSDKNPPVLSAIRYLAKLSQYEVEGTDEDLNIVKEIIRKSKFQNLSPYSKKKVIEFSLKILLNSPNVEFAVKLLNSSGLKKKLNKIGGNINDEGTLNWWMSKVPLESKQVGSGNGRTALEIINQLGLNQFEEGIVLSHETNSFIAYESITRSPRGGANVFVSRNGFSGENAAFGDGFYTKYGKSGARGSNLTIRFKLNPRAKEGHDFLYKENGDSLYFIILNKNALEIIPEDIDIEFKEFMKRLLNLKISQEDGGYIVKLIRKFARTDINKEELDFVANELLKYDPANINHAIEFWFSLDEALNYPAVFEHVFYGEYKLRITNNLLKAITQSPVWKSDPKFKLLIANSIEFEIWDPAYIVNHILLDSFWSKDQRRDWFEKLIRSLKLGLPSAAVHSILDSNLLFDLYSSDNLLVPKRVFNYVISNQMSGLEPLSYDALYQGFKELDLSNFTEAFEKLEILAADKSRLIMIFSFLKNINAFSKKDIEMLNWNLFGLSQNYSNVDFVFSSIDHTPSSLSSTMFLGKAYRENIRDYADFFVEILSAERVLEDSLAKSYLKSIFSKRKREVFLKLLKLRNTFPEKIYVALTSIPIFMFSTIYFPDVNSYIFPIAGFTNLLFNAGLDYALFRQVSVTEHKVMRRIKTGVDRGSLDQKFTCKSVLDPF